MSQLDYIYGYHAILRALRQSSQNIKTLFVQQGIAEKRLAELLHLASDIGISVQYMAKAKLDALVAHQNHQGVVAVYKPEKAQAQMDIKDLLAELKTPAFLLILDGVQDPHNLGACIRSAHAAGVHAIIAPKDNAVGITPVVRKVACGAAELTPFIQVTNLATTMRYLKEQGIWLFGASEHAQQSLYQTNLTGPVAIVMGAEGKGMRRLTSDNCDALFSIPTYGTIASLNVSVATGICLFEAARQRNLK